MGKKFIKLMSMIVAGCMLLGCLAGCGKGSSGGSGNEETGSSVVESKQSGTDEEGSSEGETKADKEKENRFPDRANANTGTGKVKDLEEGDVAPDFTATLVDGSTFTLSDFDDKVVLINFFATWCGPCMREMPAFETLKADEYSDLEILCVDCMEDKKNVDKFVKEYGYTFPIAYDVDGTIEKYYPTDGIPYTLVINKGVIAKIYIGAMDAETQYKEYKGAIDECLGR